MGIIDTNEVEKIWVGNYAKNVKMDKNVKNLILKLKEAGYTLAVLSNTVSSHADYNKKHGFYDDFALVLLSNEVWLRKPDKRFFQLALERLSLAPN